MLWNPQCARVVFGKEQHKKSWPEKLRVAQSIDPCKRSRQTERPVVDLMLCSAWLLKHKNKVCFTSWAVPVLVSPLVAEKVALEIDCRTSGLKISCQ